MGKRVFRWGRESFPGHDLEHGVEDLGELLDSTSLFERREGRWRIGKSVRADNRRIGCIKQGQVAVSIYSLWLLFK